MPAARAALVLLLALAACAPAERAAEPAPPPAEAAAEDPAQDPAVDPAPDPLYAETEAELRQAFTDGLFGLYRAEADPAAARRLGREGIDAWLTTLALSNAEAAALAREALGPVLEQRYVVGFVLADANPAACATVREVLYVPVPDRFQGPDRRFDGLVVRDACDLDAAALCRTCVGGYGTAEGGGTCSCVCTLAECPGTECVSC